MKDWLRYGIRALPIVIAFLLGGVYGVLTEKRQHVHFSGEPSRGVFVPQSGIKYVPPPISTEQTWKCLVAVAGDDPAVWHYRVWRDDDPENALTGKGAVLLPQ